MRDSFSKSISVGKSLAYRGRRHALVAEECGVRWKILLERVVGSMNMVPRNTDLISRLREIMQQA